MSNRFLLNYLQKCSKWKICLDWITPFTLIFPNGRNLNFEHSKRLTENIFRKKRVEDYRKNKKLYGQLIVEQSKLTFIQTIDTIKIKGKWSF